MWDKIVDLQKSADPDCPTKSDAENTQFYDLHIHFAIIFFERFKGNILAS